MLGGRSLNDIYMSFSIAARIKSPRHKMRAVATKTNRLLTVAALIKTKNLPAC